MGLGGKFAVGVIGLSVWMLLMTAIYFHTWFEKVSDSSELLLGTILMNRSLLGF